MLERLGRDKHSSLFGNFETKRFYNFDYQCQYYKTFLEKIQNKL